MRSMIRLATAMSTAAVFTLSFAGISSVASAHSNVAQNVAQAAACAPTFGADVDTALSDFKTVATTPTTDKLAALGLTLVTLRYKYEDTPAPAGCEATQDTNLKKLILAEDGVFLDLGLLLDNKGTTAYNDLISKSWLPRIQTLTAAATPGAPPAAAATMAAASASGCPAASYVTQVFTDMGAIFGLKVDPTDPAVVGASGLAYINLRYKYEDVTPAAGCELGTQHLTQLLSLLEDNALMSFAQLGDKTNATSYSDFAKNIITLRGKKMTPLLSVDFPQPAAPAATMAATAAK